MRRIVALLFIIALLLSFQPARAQSEIKLSSVDVWIWPEYDQPSVLVIYHITVSPDATLPANMTFRIPAAAEKPHVLAIGPTADAVTDMGVEYTLKPNGEWTDVNVLVTGPAIQLEYYDPSLNKQGAKRQIDYTWPGDYAVDRLIIELQQPFGASNLTTEPLLNQTNNIANDLTYYVGTFGPFAAGESFSVKTNYQKPSDDVSVDLMPVNSSAPVDNNTAGRITTSTYLPWLGVGLGVLLITGGLYYYFRGSARPSSTARRRHPSNVEPAEGQTYCSQCGTRARSGDRFCRVCGSRLQSNG